MADSTKYYVFYDGDCGFCNYWVQWILEKDKKDRFLFASLQSSFGQRFLKDRNLETQELSTLILWKPSVFYLTKSKAVFKIGGLLGGMPAILSHLKFLPSAFTDIFYDMVAANRKKIAIKKCRILTEKERKKFIED